METENFALLLESPLNSTMQLISLFLARLLLCLVIFIESLKTTLLENMHQKNFSLFPSSNITATESSSSSSTLERCQNETSVIYLATVFSASSPLFSPLSEMKNDMVFLINFPLVSFCCRARCPHLSRIHYNLEMCLKFQQF